MYHKKIEDGLREQIFKNTWAVFEELENEVKEKMQVIMFKIAKGQAVTIDDYFNVYMEVIKSIYQSEFKVLNPLLLEDAKELFVNLLEKSNTPQQGKK